MKPVYRHPVSKGYSARKFRQHTTRTAAANISPMRGGWRL